MSRSVSRSFAPSILPFLGLGVLVLVLGIRDALGLFVFSSSRYFDPYSLFHNLYAIARIALCAIAIAVVVQKQTDSNARLFAWGVLLQGLSNFWWYHAPDGWVIKFSGAVHYLGLGLGAALLFRFLLQLAGPHSPRWATLASFALAIAVCLAGLTAGTAMLCGLNAAHIPPALCKLGIPAEFANDVFLWVLVGANMVLLFAAARSLALGLQAHRRQNQLALLSVLALTLGSAAAAALQAWFGSSLLSTGLDLLGQACAVAGLGYALAARRLFDIEVILRRSVVLTLIALLCFVGYGVIELTAGKAFSELIGQFAGRIVGIGDNPSEEISDEREAMKELAQFTAKICAGLCVIFAFRKIEHLTEHAVDKLLFRERHAAVERLRDLAASLARRKTTLGDMGELLSNLKRHLGTAFASVLHVDGQGRFKAFRSVGTHSPLEIRPRDALVGVLLRADGIVRLPVPGSAVGGSAAVPIFRNGRLEAILLLGARRERFDQAENDALAAVARELGRLLGRLHVPPNRRKRKTSAFVQGLRRAQQWAARPIGPSIRIQKPTATMGRN